MTAKDGKERHLSGWLGSWASPASPPLWGWRGGRCAGSSLVRSLGGRAVGVRASWVRGCGACSGRVGVVARGKNSSPLWRVFCVALRGPVGLCGALLSFRLARGSFCLGVLWLSRRRRRLRCRGVCAGFAPARLGVRSLFGGVRSLGVRGGCLLVSVGGVALAKPVAGAAVFAWPCGAMRGLAGRFPPSGAPGVPLVLPST